MTLLQKILEFLGSSHRGSASLSNAERRQVEEALTRLVLEPPQAILAAVVSVDGLIVACFPRQGIEQDRISAMTAATLSLGERIAGELGCGDLRYTMIAGDKMLHLMIVLSKDYALALLMRRDASLDSTLSAVRESAGPLLQALRIDPKGLGDSSGL